MLVRVAFRFAHLAISWTAGTRAGAPSRGVTGRPAVRAGARRPIAERTGPDAGSHIVPTDVIDTEFVSLDERFRGLDGDVVVKRLHTGARKSEGPVWFPAGRYLVWSDIPNSRLLRWDETTGAVGVFRHDSGHANGNTIDREGRLATCEQGNRRVTRTEHDRTITVLADSYRGKPLNSPNDVVVRHDGSQEQDGQYVFRLDPVSGALTVVADNFVRPNGLAFSPDERRLYVAHTRQEPIHIRAFDVREDGTLAGGDIYPAPTG